MVNHRLQEIFEPAFKEERQKGIEDAFGKMKSLILNSPKEVIDEIFNKDKVEICDVLSNIEKETIEEI